MKNKKEILISELHGRLEAFAGIPELVKDIDGYLPSGHVDTELLIELLTFVNETQKTVETVMVSLCRAIGMTEEDMRPQKKGKSAPEGAKWSTEEILKHCTLDGNVLKLPNVRFDKKNYALAKTWIEEAGGIWQGGKVQGFTFPFDARRVFSILNQGKRCNLAQEYQYFATPAGLADWLVSLAGGVSGTDTILEPSAGTGAIVKAIIRSSPGVMVDCFELMPENIEILSKIDGVSLVGTNFDSPTKKKYTKIIANPPFSKNQDVDHLLRMYECLAENGVMAVITSRHWQLGQEKKCVDFRKWIESHDAKVFPIEAGEFKESGTSVPTLAVVIHKKQ